MIGDYLLNVGHTINTIYDSWGQPCMLCATYFFLFLKLFLCFHNKEQLRNTSAWSSDKALDKIWFELNFWSRINWFKQGFSQGCSKKSQQPTQILPIWLTFIEKMCLFINILVLFSLFILLEPMILIYIDQHKILPRTWSLPKIIWVDLITTKTDH